MAPWLRGRSSLAALAALCLAWGCHDLDQQLPDSGSVDQAADAPADRGKAPPDVAGPDVAGPDSKAPDSKPPDSKPPDSKLPDSKTPDSKTPDSKAPDSKAPDSKVLDATPPDTAPPADTQPPDTVAWPDQCMPIVTCTSKGYECGTIMTGCAAEKCGTCAYPKTCAGGGQPYMCGCVASWKQETVQKANKAGTNMSLVVDKALNVHVAYIANNPQILRYAVRSSYKPGWSATNVPIASNAYLQHVALAVDDAGGVHISYWDGQKNIGDLMHAYRKSPSSAWVSTPVDYSKFNPRMWDATGIAVDNKKKVVHIGYAMHHEPKNKVYLKYVYHAHSTIGSKKWTFAAVEGMQYNAGGKVSVVVDGNSVVHMAYGSVDQNSKLGKARYAHRAFGAGWKFFTVDSAVPGIHSSLAVDLAGGVHVAYHDPKNKKLRYAHKPFGALTTFKAQTLDPGAKAGAYSSMVADPKGGIHLSYQDVAGKNLRYAHRSLVKGWTIATVDSATETGLHTSLAVDAKNVVHIGYRTTPDLARYARLLYCK